MAERYKFTDPHQPPAASAGDETDNALSPTPAGRPSAAGGPAGGERLDREVQKAQEQLLSLKRQQEFIEKQKRELEELSRRQEELEQGKTEMVDKLTRALVIFDRQTTEAQKRVEQLRATTDSFGAHLQGLEAINPKTWAANDLHKELNRALSMVDHARSEFNQSRARLHTDPTTGADITPADTSGGGGSSGEYDQLFRDRHDRDFLYWLKAGLAFTLPLLVFGLIALIVYCWLALGSIHP